MKEVLKKLTTTRHQIKIKLSYLKAMWAEKN